MEVPVADKLLTLGVVAEQKDCDALPLALDGSRWPSIYRCII
jgi:hypothetical protein